MALARHVPKPCKNSARNLKRLSCGFWVWTALVSVLLLWVGSSDVELGRRLKVTAPRLSASFSRPSLGHKNHEQSGVRAQEIAAYRDRRQALRSSLCAAAAGALLPQLVCAASPPSIQETCNDSCMTDLFGQYKAPDIGKEFDENDSRPRDNVETLYGTITPSGVRTILERLDVGSSDVFTDLGSGIGNVVLQVGVNTPVKKARGIEFLRGRHAEALRHLDDFKHRYEYNPRGRIDFVNGDITKYDFSDSTIVFADSVAFPPKLMESMQASCESNVRLKYLITYKPLEFTRMKFLGAIDGVKMDFARYGFKYNVYSNVPGAKLGETSGA